MNRNRPAFRLSDKTGIVEFARAPAARGVRLLSTGGTAKLLADAGLTVTEVDRPHRFAGNSGWPRQDAAPQIHGGLLAKI